MSKRAFPSIQRCESHRSEEGPRQICCYAAEVLRLRERATIIDGMRQTEREIVANANLKIKNAAVVLAAARRFVPDPQIIQWERRELDLHAAFVAFDKP